MKKIKILTRMLFIAMLVGQVANSLCMDVQSDDSLESALLGFKIGEHRGRIFFEALENWIGRQSEAKRLVIEKIFESKVTFFPDKKLFLSDGEKSLFESEDLKYLFSIRRIIVLTMINRFKYDYFECHSNERIGSWFCLAENDYGMICIMYTEKNKKYLEWQKDSKAIKWFKRIYQELLFEKNKDSLKKSYGDYLSIKELSNIKKYIVEKEIADEKKRISVVPWSKKAEVLENKYKGTPWLKHQHEEYYVDGRDFEKRDSEEMYPVIDHDTIAKLGYFSHHKKFLKNKDDFVYAKVLLANREKDARNESLKENKMLSLYDIHRTKLNKARLKKEVVDCIVKTHYLNGQEKVALED